LVRLGVQICIYKWQYSNGWCKGHSCGRSLTFQVVRIPFHFPRFWMPLICLHFHFRINENIQSSSLNSNLDFCINSSQRSFCFANYQSSQWHDLPSKICHSPCIEKKELPFWESLSSLTIYLPSKIWKSSHTIYMILVLQIKLLFVLQQASCSEALHRQEIQLTSLKIITKNCLNILFNFSR